MYLHGLSGSSKIAYGAVIYIKAVTRSGDIKVSLVSSKARVVPARKKHTIPRLELLSNLISARLIKTIWDTYTYSVTSIIRTPIIRTFYNSNRFHRSLQNWHPSKLTSIIRTFRNSNIFLSSLIIRIKES